MCVIRHAVRLSPPLSAINSKVVLQYKLQVQFATWTAYLGAIIPGIMHLFPLIKRVADADLMSLLI